MKRHIFFAIFVLLPPGIMAEGFSASTSDTIGITHSVKEAADVKEFARSGFYTIRPDFRKCAAPLCGGYFVKKVNRNRTLCADGQTKNECYVAEIVWADNETLPVDTSKGNLIIRGSIANKGIQPSPGVGVLTAIAAFEPATATTTDSKAIFVGLKNNGITCITSPCFSIDEHVLGSSTTRLISSLDLSQVGASQEQLDAANARLNRGKRLLAAGHNRQTNESAGIGLEFVAQQFYLPVDKPANICPDGYSASAGQCVTPIGCVAPEIELWEYGGAAIIDPVTGEISSNIARSCVTQCEPPATLDGPALCSIYYP